MPLALGRFFTETAMMNEVTNWKVPKWPFFLGNALLLIFAYGFILRAPHAIHHWEIAAACVALGAVINLIPFYLDYRAMERALELSTLGAVGEKIQNLEKLAEQINSATNQWALTQKSLQTEDGKTAAAAKAFADQMAAMTRQFSELTQKIESQEKAVAPPEVEEPQTGEAEWLQLLMRVLDQVSTLHTAAVRTGDANFIEPVTSFQKACHDIVQSAGLVPFSAETDEPFNAEWYQVAGMNSEPPKNAIIAETISTGYTLEGQVLRPAIVRLRGEKIKPATPMALNQSAPVKNQNAELPL